MRKGGENDVTILLLLHLRRKRFQAGSRAEMQLLLQVRLKPDAVEYPTCFA